MMIMMTNNTRMILDSLHTFPTIDLGIIIVEIFMLQHLIWPTCCCFPFNHTRAVGFEESAVCKTSTTTNYHHYYHHHHYHCHRLNNKIGTTTLRMPKMRQIRRSNASGWPLEVQEGPRPFQPSPRVPPNDNDWSMPWWIWGKFYLYSCSCSMYYGMNHICNKMMNAMFLMYSFSVKSMALVGLTWTFTIPPLKKSY